MNKSRTGRVARLTAAVVMGSMLSGCAAVALTALGIGASTGVSHTLNGMTYRTFTAPVAKVRGASMTALNRMGIKVEGKEQIQNGEVIKAASGDRAIEIELEVISPNTTRMKTTAKKGLFYDNATSVEIILQTEKILG